MSVWRGTVHSVETIRPRGFLSSDQTSGTTSLAIYSGDVFLSETDTGFVVINGNTYAFTSVTVSTDESITPSTLVISPGLVQNEINGEPVGLVSPTETKFAQVSDGVGDLVRCRVPHNLKAYTAMSDGLRAPGDEETVDVNRVNGELVILNVIGISDLFDASTTPVVTSTEGGERVEINGDGIFQFTNDPVVEWLLSRSVQGIAFPSTGDVWTVGESRLGPGVEVFTKDGVDTSSAASTHIGPAGTDTADNLYIAETATVYKYDNTFSLVTSWATGFGGVPSALAVDQTTNHVIVTTGGGGMKSWTATGTLVFSNSTSTLAVAVDGAGVVYAPDYLTGTVKRFSPTGVAGATFPIPIVSVPSAIAVDDEGTIFVGYQDGSLLQYDPTGLLVETFILDESIRQLAFLTFDSDGDLFFTGNSNLFQPIFGRLNHPGVLTQSSDIDSSSGTATMSNLTVNGTLRSRRVTSDFDMQITAGSAINVYTSDDLTLYGDTGATLASGTDSSGTVVTSEEGTYIDGDHVHLTSDHAVDITSATTFTVNSTGVITINGTGTWTNGTVGKATQLATARTINGVAFDGTANISIVNITGNAATATKLATARNINGVAFDGTANITVADATKEPTITAGTSAQYWRGDKTMQTLNQDAVPDGTTNKAYTATDKTRLANTSGTNTGDQTTVTGNAGTATALQTARLIGGTSFNGTADITPALVTAATKLNTARLINGVSFDGTADITVPASRTVITPTLANATTTTETVVIKFAIPAGYLTTELMQEIVFMSQLSSTATLIWKVYLGPLGTTADPALITFDTTPAATGTNSHQTGKILVRQITTGTTGTATAGGYVSHGIDLGDGVGPVSGTFTPATVNTTVANILSVSVKQSAANTTTMRAAVLTKLGG